MKFTFKEPYIKVINKIVFHLIEKKLPVRMIENGETVEFRIQKWGTSVLSFKVVSGDGVRFILVDEKIAWSHKMQIDDVKLAINTMVTDLGGTVL